MTDHIRIPPQNLDAERGVLGSILLDPAVLPEVASFLRAEDFYLDRHQVLYRGLTALGDAAKPIDCVTLADHMEHAGTFKQVGGDDYLATLVNETPHPVNAPYYASIVRQKATLRCLIDAMAETLDECYSNRLTADQALEQAEQRVFAISEAASAGDTLPLAVLAQDAMRRISARSEGEYSGVATGFVDLDNLTDGLADGSLVVLAARPSLGKTAMALQVADNAAAAGVPVLFVSLEMSGLELAERMLVFRSRVDGAKIRTGHILHHEFPVLGQAYDALRIQGRIWVDETASRTVGQIAANARRHRARHKIGLVVVDYLQLVTPGDESAPRVNRQEQVAAISRRLKCVAKELHCPVLVLSQLNRESEKRTDRRPRLADLRESGAIEADADMVLLLHRPEFYDPNDSPGLAELIVAKNRNGATGTIKLTFLKHLARFEDRHSGVAPIDTGDF